MTFNAWLKQQIGRNDPIGDLAYDAAHDKTRPRSSKYAAWRAHLVDMNASVAARETLKEAFREYRKVGAAGKESE